MKKALTAFFLAGLIAALILAAPAFACACGPLPSAQQQGSGSISPYSVYNPNDPCTWPTDIRPTSCPQPPTTK